MGTKMAPSYANIFMGRLERQLLTSVSLKPSMWLRFIDDVDMHWCHGHSELQTFLDEVNSFHPTIKFTSVVTNDAHVFLDTISHIENSKLVVDLYTKPTDKHQYLLPTSCHPKHCSNNIPYSLALRIRRICTQASTFECRAKELANHLLDRGYKKDAVVKSIQKASALERKTLLDYKEKSNEQKRVPFVLTYHPDLPNVRKITEKHWPTIAGSRKLGTLFEEKPVIAYRRPKSLRDILVKAKIKAVGDPSPTGSCGPCNVPRCQTCHMMSPACTFKSATGAISSITGNYNCKTSNAIYLMTCKVCKKQYVGETKLSISRRINLHRSDYNTRRFKRSPVAEHFSHENHAFGDISLCVIESDTRWDDTLRKRRETYWIRRLSTLQPYGINKGE